MERQMEAPQEDVPRQMSSRDVLTPRSEIDQRIQALKSRLAAADLDAALVLQTADLFYFTGTIQQSHLYVPCDGDPLLMVRKDFERAAAESPIDRIVPIRSPRQLPELLRRHGHPKPRRVGIEMDVLPANLYLNFRQLLDGIELVDASTDIRLIRAVKSEYEIALIAEAARLSDRVAAGMAELLAEGVTEIELAGQVEALARKLGHQGIIRMRLWGSELFYGHLMAGPSAAVPSYLASPTGGRSLGPAVAQGPGLRPIRRHEPVLLDYVFAHRGYLSDHTRIFSLGELPDHLIEAHEAMLQIQQTVKNEARPGMVTGRLYEMATELAAELGYADNFMGAGRDRIQFIGHGIGIELDECPFLAKGQTLELQADMIIALEPKAIFPGIGVVGVENTHRVTTAGLQQFGCFNETVNIVL
jgi:Xaa-Pro dipeptidase